MVRRRGLIGLVAVLTLFLGGLASAAMAGEVTVFAAASLKNALDEIAETFEAETGHRVVVSLAGSSALARQIAYGAPADVYLSANTMWMDYLENKGLVLSESRVDLLENQLVLIAPKGAVPVARPVIGEDVRLLLGDGRLAMALVDGVPAGQYGKAALSALGVWDDVAPQVAQADNVRAALALVALGEAPLGIVYETDARASDDVVIVGAFPADLVPEIIYPAAVVAGRGRGLGVDFLQYMQGDTARAAFERQGFRMRSEGGS
ncbi:molybdate transport system substrate-binding protein [Shimia aestuarii]|uniref:Molybdate-binding protein ModA n=2 Tax=Shimia aestuarii TaxID=254406 RepID=A0A1I4SUF1_9RHOB|nr:molybdate transport system substrate-binding protein [Shimia aestuarii]